MDDQETITSGTKRLWERIPESFEGAGRMMAIMGVIWIFMKINPNPDWWDIVIIFVAAMFAYFLAAMWRNFYEDWDFWKGVINKLTTKKS